MSQIFVGLALVVFIAIWLTALITLIACVVYAFKAVLCARPGIKLWGRDTPWNPANVLLSSNMLTENGLRYRRKCLISLSIFTVCVGGTLLLAAITGQLR